VSDTSSSYETTASFEGVRHRFELRAQTSFGKVSDTWSDDDRDGARRGPGGARHVRGSFGEQETITAATSSGSARRPSGLPVRPSPTRVAVSLLLGEPPSRSHASVAVGPGVTALQRIRRSHRDRRRGASREQACLHHGVVGHAHRRRLPALDETLTIEPCPRSRMPGAQHASSGRAQQVELERRLPIVVVRSSSLRMSVPPTCSRGSRHVRTPQWRRRPAHRPPRLGQVGHDVDVTNSVAPRPEVTTRAPSAAAAGQQRARCRGRPVTMHTFSDSPSSIASLPYAVTTILLARHGETDWNREGRWQGGRPALNDNGRAQARKLRSSFARSRSTRSIRATSAARTNSPDRGEPHAVPASPTRGCARSTSARGRASPSRRSRAVPGAEHPDGETREEHASRVLAAVERSPGTTPAVDPPVTHGGRCAPPRSVSDEPIHPVANCGVLELHFRDDRLAYPYEVTPHP